MRKPLFGPKDLFVNDIESEEEEYAVVEATPQTVAVFNNHIYYYCGVDQSTVSQLVQAIKKLEKAVINVGNTFETATPEIIIHINSYGGELLAGLAACDAIRNCAAPVRTIIEGCAGSAATLISVVGDHRCMTKHSFMLLHELSSGFYGKAEEFNDEKENIDAFMEALISIYVEYAKIPKAKLKVLLKRDLWWNSEICKKYKLIDEIV